MTLKEAESRLRASLKENQKYATLVARLQIKAQIGKIEPQMRKEQAYPDDLMAEVIQIMLSKQKISNLISETSAEGAPYQFEPSSVQSILSALKTRQEQHLEEKQELNQLQADKKAKLKQLAQQMTDVLEIDDK